ncbi:hypothetical protein [Fluviicola sp.]|uniref:hypothetical protein n=1 Tax=Fluviicola sp. TaxID=1917219 RepID=UPI002624BCF6|nr:hypothetical protein [Fluviicola sp.]
MKLLFTLLSFCVLFACTITKRHFGAGYHVEWKRNHQTEEKKSNLNNKILLENNFLPDEELRTSKVCAAENEEKQDSVIVKASKPFEGRVITQKEKVFGPNIIQSDKRKALKESADNEKITEDQLAIEEKPRKVEKFTWVALSFLALGVSLLMVLSLIGFFSGPLVIAIMVLGLFVTIFSIVSVVRIRKNPDRYKAKWLTWILFGLSTVGIGALLFMVVYYLLFITNNVDFL